MLEMYCYSQRIQDSKFGVNNFQGFISLHLDSRVIFTMEILG